MPIESGTLISELDKLWPLSGDFISEGDNHLRLIKAVLKAQFPGDLGDGFSKVITVTEDEINFLDGLTSNVQDQLDAVVADDNLIAPAGTTMLFYDVAPPLGWVQNVSHNDKMLRIVNTAGGGSGGADSPIAVPMAHVHATVGHVLTVAELPTHDHTMNGGNVDGAEGGDGGNNYTFGTTGLGGAQQPGTYRDEGFDTFNTGSDDAHDHGDTVTALDDFAPLYVNIIAAIKS